MRTEHKEPSRHDAKSRETGTNGRSMSNKATSSLRCCSGKVDYVAAGKSAQLNPGAFVQGNGSILPGWYEAKVIEVTPLGRYGIRSGVNIKFLLPEVEQQVTYYIPPGENGYFARKNATYYLGYTYLGKELYRLELLIGKFVRMKIGSLKDEGGLPYVGTAAKW